MTDSLLLAAAIALLHAHGPAVVAGARRLAALTKRFPFKPEADARTPSKSAQRGPLDRAQRPVPGLLCGSVWKCTCGCNGTVQFLAVVTPRCGVKTVIYEDPDVVLGPRQSAIGLVSLDVWLDQFEFVGMAVTGGAKR